MSIHNYSYIGVLFADGLSLTDRLPGLFRTNSRKFQGAIAEYRAHGQSVNKEDLGQKLTSYENEKDGVVIEQQE